MTDLRTLLNDGDPVRDGEGLSAADAQRMRRLAVAVALEPPPARTPWLRPFALGAVASLLVVVGTMAGHRVIMERAVVPAPIEPSTMLGGGADGERRQLQFATPGGTRIIWIFDQNLRLQESMP